MVLRSRVSVVDVPVCVSFFSAIDSCPAGVVAECPRVVLLTMLENTVRGSDRLGALSIIYCQIKASDFEGFRVRTRCEQ